MTKDQITVGAILPKVLDNKARVQAALLSISKSELIRQALEHYIKFLEETNAIHNGAGLSNSRSTEEKS